MQRADGGDAGPDLEAAGHEVSAQGREVGEADDPLHATSRTPVPLVRRDQQRLAVGDHVADAAGRADQLGHDRVGPGPPPAPCAAPRQSPAPRPGSARARSGCGPPRAARRRPPPGLDGCCPQSPRSAAPAEKRLPMKMTASFRASPLPAQRINRGMNALAGRSRAKPPSGARAMGWRASAAARVALRAGSAVRPEPGIEARIAIRGRSQPDFVHARVRPKGRLRVVRPPLLPAPPGPCEGV